MPKKSFFLSAGKMTSLPFSSFFIAALSPAPRDEDPSAKRAHALSILLGTTPHCRGWLRELHGHWQLGCGVKESRQEGREREEREGGGGRKRERKRREKDRKGKGGGGSPLVSSPFVPSQKYPARVRPWPRMHGGVYGVTGVITFRSQLRKVCGTDTTVLLPILLTRQHKSSQRNQGHNTRKLEKESGCLNY